MTVTGMIDRYVCVHGRHTEVAIERIDECSSMAKLCSENETSDQSTITDY